MRLIVEEGYNRGSEFVLGDRPAVVGRGEDCAIQILDEGVSRAHAELRLDQARVLVRDLGSRNGTRVNGVPVAEGEAGPGDRIAVGGVRFLVAPSTTASSVTQRSTAELALPGSGIALPEEPVLVPGFFSGEILGESAPIRALLKALERAAPTRASVLIQGESGTGKELVAQALHRLSTRRRAPFIVVNGAALPSELVESELLGHEKGAFTGAIARKIGLAEAANGGTLFLDEIGELAPATQAKLLRFLESGEILRVGSTSPLRLDVRLLAATHRDLDHMVKEKTFREDLLYRLRVLELRVPPLRERPGDVRLLAQAFLSRFTSARASFSGSALAALETYRWPGNVRELRNAVEAASILAPGATVEAADLPERVRASEARLPLKLRDIERRAIQVALERNGGNRTRAAEELGIDRKTLAQRLKDAGDERESS